jgi:N-methylhydantoinase A
VADIRIGIDVGGTYTDVVGLDASTGRLATHKLESTPDDPSEAISTGLHALLEREGWAIGDVAYFAHGSTVATNALLQGKGARVALVTTRGFRDILEIGRQTRPHLYDLQVDKPTPLASRDLRFEVTERIGPDGEIIEPLDERDLLRVVDRIRVSGAQSVAVCLLHGYRFPEHEQLVRRAIARELPHLPMSVAHELQPEFREFERVNTTVVNAFLQPLVGSYVNALSRRLVASGIRCRPYMTQSNGGVISLDTAASQSYRTALSGPSSGVVAASYLASAAGLANVITLDMGGTSTDLGLIHRGDYAVATSRTVGGYPIKTPMIDIHTIGAGGGSVGWCDAGGLLKVGPMSAGAVPGPACLGRGGDQATVTDANVALGILNAESFLGGRVPVRREFARAALARLAGELGIDPDHAARGLIQVAVANMVGATRVISVQRGHDPRDFTLVPFGGAGPLHGAWVMRELGIPRMLVPETPGLLCAFGLLVTDLRRDFSQTSLRPADSADPDSITSTYEGLERSAEAWLDAEGFRLDRRAIRRTVDMRYRGQNHELPVAVPGGRLNPTAIATVIDDFYDAHEQAYGYAARGEPAEFVTFRVEALGLMEKAPLQREPVDVMHAPTAAIIGTRRTILDEPRHTSVYDRGALRPGHWLDGPAIIEQMDSTTLVLAGQIARVDGLRNLVVEEHR